MNFSVIGPEEARSMYRTAANKWNMVKVLADLTVSEPEEVARFLGIKLLSYRPYIVEESENLR